MKKTILVVEDFESIRNFVCETLEKKGYATIGVSNGNEAFDILSKQSVNVNLVLSDYNMTTESHPDKMKAAREAGLSAWIQKPYKAV